MSMPGRLLSHPARVTRPSKRSACIIASTESAMISRLTSDARIPSWPIEMPSDTAMVMNSSGNPPASRTPSFDRLASRSSGMLQGVTSFHDDATPTCGLSQSSSVIPTARSIARAPGPVGPVGDLAAPRLDVDRCLAVSSAMAGRLPARPDRPQGDRSEPGLGAEERGGGLAVGLALAGLHHLAHEEAGELAAGLVVAGAELLPLLGVGGDDLVDDALERAGVERLEALLLGDRRPGPCRWRPPRRARSWPGWR